MYLITVSQYRLHGRRRRIEATMYETFVPLFYQAILMIEKV